MNNHNRGKTTMKNQTYRTCENCNQPYNTPDCLCPECRERAQAGDTEWVPRKHPVTGNVTVEQAAELLQKQLINRDSRTAAEVEITSKRFKDRRTGQIVTQFNIFDIKYMKEVQE